jgi:hypothetical protein
MPSFPRESAEVSDALRRFYFSLDGLLNSVIHPKYMDNTLVSALGLTLEDVEFSSSIDEFFDSCQGHLGAPSTAEQTTRILRAIHALMTDVPTSEFDYRFCRHQLVAVEKAANDLIARQVPRR